MENVINDKVLNNNFYYTLQRVLSFNSLINIIIGERGVGKSYTCKKHVINRFIKKNEQFVYLRRYKTELKSSVPKFFDDIIANNEFPEAKFKVKNNLFYIDDNIAGYALPLSTANILKSTSFAQVKTIIFDEFIIDKGCYHYLQNEVEQFLDIIETIARLRDVRVFMLGNAISITNPYFTYFDLTLPYNSDIALFKDGSILVNYIKNESYREIKKASRFGKLIEGTDYGKYAIDNEFLRDSKAFIRKKEKWSKFYFILILNNKCYGVWNDYKNGFMFISEDYDPNCPVRYALNTKDHTEASILIRVRNSPLIKSVIDHYRLARLCFESQKIKNIVLQELTRYLTF